MKRIVMMAIALSGAGFAVHAQTSAKADSLKVVNLQEVQVVSTRATAKTPVAFTNVRKEQISKQNFGQDIPFLLSTTPSVLTTSDAGAGVGYTTIRVRGTDATRINVTANGIPMNDAESHAIFWVNTPDFASSLEDMQIQRPLNLHIFQRRGEIGSIYPEDGVALSIVHRNTVGGDVNTGSVRSANANRSISYSRPGI